ncbi:hypothetical protein PHISP_01965 [Aspergillus sp. HF37]|nr:hypothetical protein PHISP_01965 [Aspergillus sp. HF37]
MPPTMLKTLTSTATRRSLLQLQPPTTASHRLLHTTRPVYSIDNSNNSKSDDRKPDDRTSLHPERTEGTLSGTDSEVAEHASAYDPSKTTPESEFAASEAESKLEGKHANPLNVSGANQEIARARDPKEGGADRNADKSGPSSRGRTRKHGVVNEDKTGTGSGSVSKR